ncbi:Protocadherin Fat 1 [Araneus ventricosus]|uniref:Protocadherin Fat 1 n=1 Tax=Araneus ventricosus TaxID=182803 RepID=A0A4Y2R2F7_ARAVE|nr:Protocadherin Fat 1 [Araneus ventricosus]
MPRSDFFSDFCSSNPCKNDGICMTVNNEGKCICQSHSSGKFCEIGPCYPNPCQNSGLCRILNGRAQCTCLEPYSGVFCEKANDYCISAPCKNNGTCFNVNNGTYACLCQNGYLGTNCELECDCGLNGFCSLKSGVKVCTCETGYKETGGRCQGNLTFISNIRLETRNV